MYVVAQIRTIALSTTFPLSAPGRQNWAPEDHASAPSIELPSLPVGSPSLPHCWGSHLIPSSQKIPGVQKPWQDSESEILTFGALIVKSGSIGCEKGGRENLLNTYCVLEQARLGALK